jgi:hypothetical protein
MKRRVLLGIVIAFLMGGCAPVMVGLTVGQIASSVIQTVVLVKEMRQLRAEREQLARSQTTEDFLDVGDSLDKALTRLGKPHSREQGTEMTFYLFRGQRLVNDMGQIVAKDLRVGVDGAEKIAQIEILEPQNIGTSEG